MSNQDFALGLTYWPRRRAGAEGVLSSWVDADFGAVRAELGHIAELGVGLVRIELRWAEAQPGPARIGSVALRGLERALDLAQDSGLRVVIGLMSGALGAVMHLPDWAVGLRLPPGRLRAPITLPDDLPPILAGDRYRREPARDLYADAELRSAQEYLLREVIGNFGAHPAVAGWLLGADLARPRPYASAAAAAAWWTDLAERVRTHGVSTIFGQVGAAELASTDSLRPEAIFGAGAGVVVAAPPPGLLTPAPPWSERGATFLHALVAGLLHAEARRDVPVVVADLGLPSVTAGQYAGWREVEDYGQPARAFFADADEQAALVETGLEALYRAGAAGVWLAAYADHPEGLWGLPPLDRDIPARSRGLVAPDGREKPAAAALRAFAERLCSGQLPAPAGPPALPIDPERYWRDPAGNLRELWADWQATPE